MDKNFYLFMIPDSKNHGAQNFFRRLHKNFDSKNKMLLIEDERSFKDNFSLLKNFSRNNKLKLITLPGILNDTLYGEEGLFFNKVASIEDGF